VLARFPPADGHAIKSASVNGKPVKDFSGSQVSLKNPAGSLTVEVRFE
jgi:hypothetical protein